MAFDTALDANLYQKGEGVYNAGHSDFGDSSDTDAVRIQAAIDAAKADSVPMVLVPDSMLPYSGVTFDSAVRMVREGGNRAVYDVEAYGAAEGDDSVDDQPAFDAAISAAKANGRRSIHYRGVFSLSTPLTLSGDGIAFVGGSGWGSLQAGSTDSQSVLRWTGGASYMIELEGSRHNFIATSFQNFGTGLGSIRRSSSGSSSHETFFLCSWVTPSGGTAWGTAALDFDEFAYMVFWRCAIRSSPFLRLRGDGTWVHFRHPYIRATDSGPVFDVDAGIDLFSLEGGTCDSLDGAPVLWDNVSSTKIVRELVFRAMEFDGLNTGSTQRRFAKCENVQQFRFQDCNVAGFGATSPDSLIQLTNSRVIVDGCSLRQLGSGLVDTLDAASRVFVGRNKVNMSNTSGVMKPSAEAGNIVSVTPGDGIAGRIRLHGEDVDTGAEAVFVVSVTDSSAYQVDVALSGDSDAGSMSPGQRFTLIIKNESGGAMGAITFNSHFNTSGAFTEPANGKNRSVSFIWDGTNAIEIDRGAADVDN